MHADRSQFADLLTADEAEDLANAVQDALTEQVTAYPGTSPQMVARGAYDVVMRLLGHDEDLDDEDDR